MSRETRLLDGRELRAERRGHRGAANTGAVQVLERDKRSLNARRFVCVRAAGREAHFDGRARQKISAEPTGC